jgi:hypothetical protein
LGASPAGQPAAAPPGTGLSGAPALPPAPALRAVAAPHPSYPLRCPKMTSCLFWAWGFASQNPRNWKQPTSCRPKATASYPFSPSGPPGPSPRIPGSEASGPQPAEKL